MTGFIWNLILAFTWALLTGEFTLLSFGMGFVIGFLILFFLQRVLGTHSYNTRALKTIELALVVVWDVLLANLNVAWFVITPTQIHRPGILAIPLDVKTDVEISVFANILSLTPGTLSLHISADKRTLYLHALDIPNPSRMRFELKKRIEERIIALRE